MPKSRRSSAPLAAVAAGVLAVALPVPLCPAVALGAASIMAPDSDQPFAGTFKGDGFDLLMNSAGDRFTGLLIIGDSFFPVSARAAGEGLAGTFTSEGYKFEFTAQMEGDQLLLTSDDQTHRLTRVNLLSGDRKDKPPKNPLSTRAGNGKPGARDTEFADNPSALPQTISHPTGVTLSAPEDWTVQEDEGAVALIPGDAKAGDHGPSEHYVLFYTTACGAPSVKDEAAIEDVAMQLGSTLPNQGRSAKPEYFRIRGRDAAVLRARGVSNEGKRLAAHAYVTLHDGLVIGLLGLGEEDALVESEELVRRVFSATRFAPPSREPQLVGAWSYTDSQLDRGARNDREVQTRIMLEDNGFFTTSSKVEGGDGVGSPRVEADRGRWYADEKTLILLFDGGHGMHMSYSLSGTQLTTTDALGKQQVWSR